MNKAISLVCILSLAACARSSMPPPIAAQPAAVNPANSLAPDVWQRGTPPVHWEIFANPTHDQGDDTVYSWPLLDKSGVIAFGVTCCYPAGDPPKGTAAALNFSGSLANTSEPINQGSNGTNNETAPVKIFQCAGGTQICSKNAEVMFGPNNQQYYFGTNLGLKDATAGAGNTLWATIYGAASYIASGNNGVKHLYSIPDIKDQLQDIAFTPDGNVWVTLQNHTTKTWMLAKLQPSTSHVTVYPLQLAVSPAQLFVGSDGNLWFAIGAKLYHVNASTAQVTRFALPAQSNGYLNAGPNNTIWSGYFNSASAQGLIEVSLSGTVLGSFACPATVCNPGPLNNKILQGTTGPDGNIWFAFSQQNVFIANPPTNATAGIGVYVRQSMSVSPASVTFSGAGQTQTITFSEANYSGTFTAASTNTGVVRVVKFITPHQVQIGLDPILRTLR